MIDPMREAECIVSSRDRYTTQEGVIERVAQGTSNDDFGSQSSLLEFTLKDNEKTFRFKGAAAIHPGQRVEIYSLNELDQEAGVNLIRAYHPGQENPSDYISFSFGRGIR